MTSLSKNVKFSIEKNTDKGSFVVRSKTESFNLEHIVDKDLVSFYGELSKYGVVDTGILPLSATGVLAIRSAGNHTQITFQHAPQINYINWGTYEGDRNAKTYLVAQPYRIWIGDMIDGNLYGARMFYSPYPITSADQQLYHLNLPNTNCRGYRGNGVGWQCLYHKDDWSNLPFNEKVIRFAERCSGVETFNDNNMSETDGPRFYHMNDKPAYLWDPTEWEKKTSQEGLDWTLDESLWIPVLVENLDSQDKHAPDGIPLTLGMALIGNYQAYYTDILKPKPINALTRSDLSSNITPETVASWIMRSHNTARVAYVPVNTFEESSKHRENVVLNSPKAKAVFDQLHEEEEEEQELLKFICPINGEPCSASEDEACVDSLDNTYCQSCYEENTVYCENSQSTLPSNSDYLYFDEHSSEYYDTRDIYYDTCTNCKSFQYVPSGKSLKSVFFYSSENDDNIIACVNCIETYLEENGADHKSSCSHCSKTIPLDNNNNVHPDFDNVYEVVSDVYLSTDESGKDIICQQQAVLCSTCSSNAYLCPTGHHTWLPIPKLTIPIIKELPDPDTYKPVTVKIERLCASCANPDIWQHGWGAEQISKLSTMWSVVSQAEERFVYSFKNKLLDNCLGLTIQSESEETEIIHEQLPF